MTLSERLDELAFAASSADVARELFVSRCREDPVFFINTCCDTYNPKMEEKNLPFLLFMRQEEYIRFTHHWTFYKDPVSGKIGVDCVKPKSREAGASWLEVCFDVWAWLFIPGYRAHYGSRKEDLVESAENPDALFWKFDYVVEQMSSTVPFLIPQGYTKKSDFRAKLKIVNPVNGAVITGESSNANFGRAGRAVRSVHDEKAFWGEAKAAWDSCGKTVGSRHALSTPNGQDFFWELVHPDDAQLRRPGDSVPRPKVFRLHWKDNPFFNRFLILDEEGAEMLKGKTPDDKLALLGQLGSRHIVATGNGYSPDDDIPLGQGYDDGEGNITHLSERKPFSSMPDRGAEVVYPAYLYEQTRYDETTLNREMNIDFLGSRRGRVYAEQMKAVHFGVYARNPDFPLYVGCDPGRSDYFALVWVQFNWETLEYEAIDYLEDTGRSAYFYVPLITGDPAHEHLLEAENPTDKHRDLFRRRRSHIWRINELYIDPAARQKTANSRETVISILKGYGIPLRFNDKHKEFNTRITAARKLMSRGRLVMDKARCGRLITALQNVRFKEESENSQAVTHTSGYIHDEHSHASAAFEYFACFDPHASDMERRSEDLQRLIDARLPAGDKRYSDFHRMRREPFMQQRSDFTGYGTRRR